MQVAEVDGRFGVTIGVTDERSSTPQLATIVSVTSPHTWLQTGYKLATNWLQTGYKLATNWLQTPAARSGGANGRARWWRRPGAVYNVSTSRESCVNDQRSREYSRAVRWTHG